MKALICQKIIVIIQNYPKLVSVKELGHSSSSCAALKICHKPVHVKDGSFLLRSSQRWKDFSINQITAASCCRLRVLRGLTIWNHIFVCGKGKIYWEREIETRACVKCNLTLNQGTNLAPKGQEGAAAGIFARELCVRRTRHWHERHQSKLLISHVCRNHLPIVAF